MVPVSHFMLCGLFLLLTGQTAEFIDLELKPAIGGLQLGDALLGVNLFQFQDTSAQGTQILPHVFRYLAQRCLIHHADRHHAAILSAQLLVATVQPMIAYGPGVPAALRSETQSGRRHLAARQISPASKLCSSRVECAARDCHSGT